MDSSRPVTLVTNKIAAQDLAVRFAWLARFAWLSRFRSKVADNVLLEGGGGFAYDRLLGLLAVFNSFSNRFLVTFLLRLSLSL